jgi:large conductance mechanosensitive channel
MLKEFKEFALRGSVVDLAVGIIIGAAFSSIVKSLVDDLIMPPIGLALGGVDFENFYWTLKAGAPSGPYATLADAQAAGAVTVNYGLFINALVSFLIVSLVMFLLVRGINRLQRRKKEEEAPAPETRDCPYCLSTIPLAATRCPHCTSQSD